MVLRRWSCILILASGLSLLSAKAQAYTLGNPMGATGKGKLLVSAEYELQDKKLPVSLSTESARYLLKASYGLSPWLDVFAKGGIAGLRIPMESVTFVGENQFAYGGGARATIVHLPGWRAEIFTSAQLFGYSTEGSVNEQITDASGTWTRRLDSEYVWWEYGGALGVGIRQGAMWPYLGIDICYVEGEETTRRYDVLSEEATYVGKRKVDFSSDGLMLSGFGGIDLALRGRHKLSLEFRGIGLKGFSFTVGISQRSP